MAQDYFLKIDGVDGELQDEKHKKEIHITSFHMGAVNQGTGHRDFGLRRREGFGSRHAIDQAGR